MTAETRETPMISTAEIDVHLRRMRVLWLLGELLALASALTCWLLPRLHPTVLGRGGFSLLVAAAGLWLGFSASRDARRRMERIRRAFGVHGDVGRLLRGHLMAYTWILLRMLFIAAGGQAIAVWGAGPAFSLLLSSLAVILTLMTFPTEYKTRLLLKRASME